MDKTQLCEKFPHLEFKEDERLAPFTFMKVGGPALVFVQIKEKEDLFALTSFCFLHQIPFVILGGASNVIVPDLGLKKLVIRNGTAHLAVKPDGRVVADSGVITATLSKFASDHNLTGLEPFIGVPGTVGGAVFNNSHFTAHELIGNVLESVEVCTQEGKREIWNQDQLELGYDTSIFHHNPGVILSTTFKLSSGNPDEIRAKILACAKRRTTTQPIGIPSTGCMYKNPTLSNDQVALLAQQIDIPASALKVIGENKTNVAAGFLIDKASLKGVAVGGAQVSDRHATYMINTGHATADDIEKLCEKVERAVKENYGIQLEREVFFLR